ncbi:hypothetical protein [Pseudomonas protegens]|uniref:hypothetical protein n=1 Tax=Pseudomonas protegens TaxID=380021 RepID=UPI00384C0A3E
MFFEAAGRCLAGCASPSWAHIREHGAASALAAHTENLTKVVFNNSGSEAVHLACRITRAYTGKGKNAKVAVGFDGWLDDVAFGDVSAHEAAFKDGERPTTPRRPLRRTLNGPAHHTARLNPLQKWP